MFIIGPFTLCGNGPRRAGLPISSVLSISTFLPHIHGSYVLTILHKIPFLPKRHSAHSPYNNLTFV
jgi:hypothetical protein